MLINGADRGDVFTNRHGQCRALRARPPALSGQVDDLTLAPPLRYSTLIAEGPLEPVSWPARRPRRHRSSSIEARRRNSSFSFAPGSRAVRPPSPRSPYPKPPARRSAHPECCSSHRAVRPAQRRADDDFPSRVAPHRLGDHFRGTGPGTSSDANLGAAAALFEPDVRGAGLRTRFPRPDDGDGSSGDDCSTGAGSGASGGGAGLMASPTSSSCHSRKEGS